MPSHQTHRVGPRRGLHNSPHLVDDQVGAANHRQHLSGTIAQRRCGHEATLTLTLATGHRIHAQDADQQTYHARNEGDQTGIHTFFLLRGVIFHKYIKQPPVREAGPRNEPPTETVSGS